MLIAIIILKKYNNMQQQMREVQVEEVWSVEFVNMQAKWHTSRNPENSGCNGEWR